MNGRLKRWSKEMGFRRMGKTSFGVLGGYLFSLHQGMYECTFTVNGCFPNTDAQSQMGQMLHDPGVMRENGFIGVLLNDNCISFQFNGNKKSINKMKQFMVWLIPALRKSGFTDTTVCSCCHVPFHSGEGEYVFIENRVIKVHSDCMNRMFAPGSIYDSGSYDKGYLRGFCFSILFALLGSVPSLYLYLFGWNIPILTMATVFGSYKGYEISKSKRNGFGIWICTFTSFFAYFVSYFLGFHLNKLAGTGWRFEEFESFVICAVASSLFIIFSLLFASRDMLDYSKKRKIKRIDKNRYKLS